MNIGNSANFYVKRYLRHDKVTGSMFDYEVHWPNGEELSFFVEAGVKQGEDDIGTFNGQIPFDVKKMSFGVITHNHLDHVGLLPVFIRQGFLGPIFTTYSTASLIDIPLYDSATIEDKNLKKSIASIDEVEKTLKQVVGVSYRKRIKPHKNITLVFYSNGHLVGSAIVLIAISYPGEKDIIILHTGDYKDKNVFFNVSLPPQKVRELEISNIVCESTYGDVDSDNPIFRKCLLANTAKALHEGKTVLYPTFAQGRHQEALLNIKSWKEREYIPQNTVVVIDGKSSQLYNARYQFGSVGIFKERRDFIPKDAKFISRDKERFVQRKKVMEDHRPKIILAPGGMASYGAITSYASYLISRDDVLIHLLGYCSPESSMYKIRDAKFGDTVDYNGKKIKKRCEIMQTAEMSSHAPRNVLLRFIRYFPNTLSISINHGDTEKQISFRNYLLDNLFIAPDQITVADSHLGVRIESSGITDVFEVEDFSTLEY